MNPDDFSQLLETHGSNWQRWPDQLRSEAQALLAESPEARTLFEEARRLDTVLDQFRLAPAGDQLKASILERTAGLQQQPLRTLTGETQPWRLLSLARVALFAGLFLLGIMLGSSGSLFAPAHTDVAHLDTLLRETLFAEEWIP